jgi:hypothetical protein
MLDFDSIDVWPSKCETNVAIRNVLCHELTHNVHGPHDANFWSLCKKLEKEVISLDPFSSQSAHLLSTDEIYESEAEHVDGGGWEGGTYTLGGDGAQDGLSRRDILADAAMRRMTRNSKRDSQSGS